MTEIQRYEVLGSHPGFELRQYADHTLVTKPMSGAMNSAATAAFHYLVSYLGGQNEKQQQIAMTAPVLQQKSERGFDVSFVMPHDMVEAPSPLGPDMSVQRVPGELIAAKQFAGSATDALFERKAEQLLAAVEKAGFEATSGIKYARYNGPWTPPFLRRNEVLVAVAPISSQ